MLTREEILQERGRLSSNVCNIENTLTNGECSDVVEARNKIKIINSTTRHSNRDTQTLYRIERDMDFIIGANTKEFGD